MPAKFTKITALSAVFVMLAASANAQQVKRYNAGLHSASGSCARCDLSGKDIPNMTLSHANFSESIFNRANLSGGRIISSDLSKTQFRKAFLARVEGRKVNLTGANLQDVTLTESNFTDSVLSNTDMRRADLARSAFSKSYFNDANLSSVSAPDSGFEGSHFIDARFNHANLRRAKLDGGVFRNAKFGAAKLHDATMVGADFSGANLSLSEGLTQAQLDTACGDPGTQVPMGLSLTYCADTMDAQVQGSHAHGANDIRHDKAALRVDRALSALENVMSQTPGANKKLRKDLQKIHSDLMSAQRALEK